MRKVLSILFLLFSIVADAQFPLPSQVGFTKPSGVIFSFVLDDYTGAAIGYSLRKLRSAYSGNLIRVRRSNDNAEQDIGAVNNVLDVVSLMAFVGANSGYIAKGYDQTGNGNDAIQATAGSQPRIVNAGTLETQNGLPTIFFDGTDDFLSFTNVSAVPDWSLFMVIKRSATGVISPNVTSATTSGPLLAQYSDDNLYVQRVSSVGNGNYAFAADATATFCLLEAFVVGAGINAYKDGSAYSLSGHFFFPAGGINFNSISKYNTSNFSSGYMSEVILYASDQNSNRTGIEGNINSFYTIY